MSDWRDAGRVLLGSWPSQVAAWGREGIAAYVLELEGRGLTPDGAIGALRQWEEKWPPSAGELAAAARTDHSTPTFDEAVQLICRALKAPGYRERLRERQRETGSTFICADDEDALRKEAIATAVNEAHPIVRGFVATQGVERLHRMLGRIEDPEWGEKHRGDLQAAWDRHVESGEQRELAAIASGGRVGLRELDPLASLGIQRPVAELVAGDNNQRREQ